MKSLFALQKPLHQHEHEIDTCDTRREEAQRAVLQTQREAFDMAIDETLEGLQEVQQILNRFKATCFAVPMPEIAPRTRLHVQRTSHHCNRLIEEVLQLLQPFSQEMQALGASPSNKNRETSRDEWEGESEQ